MQFLFGCLQCPFFVAAHWYDTMCVWQSAVSEKEMSMLHFILLLGSAISIFYWNIFLKRRKKLSRFVCSFTLLRRCSSLIFNYRCDTTFQSLIQDGSVLCWVWGWYLQNMVSGHVMPTQRGDVCDYLSVLVHSTFPHSRVPISILLQISRLSVCVSRRRCRVHTQCWLYFIRMLEVPHGGTRYESAKK